MARFLNRSDAGRQLAERLLHYAGRQDVIALALPRGGVPVAFEVAKALHVPLDVFMVRKLTIPGYKKLAMGAVASGGTRVLNDSLVHSPRVPPGAVQQVTARESRELERREQIYRGDRPRPDLRAKTILLIDDGLVSGVTMRTAVKALRTHGPNRIVVGVPTAAAEVTGELEWVADEAVWLQTPPMSAGIASSYQEFPQVTDDDVRDLLARAAEPMSEQ